MLVLQKKFMNLQQLLLLYDSFIYIYIYIANTCFKFKCLEINFNRRIKYIFISFQCLLFIFNYIYNLSLNSFNYSIFNLLIKKFEIIKESGFFPF